MLMQKARLFQRPMCSQSCTLLPKSSVMHVSHRKWHSCIHTRFRFQTFPGAPVFLGLAWVQASSQLALLLRSADSRMQLVEAPLTAFL